MVAFDPKKIEADLKWLKANPQFREKPASILEFLGPDYLNIEKGVRPGVKDELIELFGTEVNPERIAKFRWGMFTGAIGIGKTTMASIILPYMVHWVLCLNDPQEFYNLLPGSRIAFMMMSTSEDQARETVFGDVKARIQHSPWFQNNWPIDPAFKNQIRFDKDIWILPGSSQETSFEGYNILGGILDEADSHKVTANKSYAEDGWNTINGRIDSRFQDRGFLLTVGQMKKANGFASDKYKELVADPDNAHTVRMTIWESLGWERFLKPDGTHDSFWYDRKRKEIVSEQAAKMLGYPEHIMEIPRVYEKNFRNKPEQALRDLAGIPPQAGDAFISLTHKIDEAVERWRERYGSDSPVNTNPRRPQIEDWFRDPTPLRRAVHLDIGISGNGDAAGIVMGHVSHMVEVDNEEGDSEKPYIIIDCIIRVKASPGQEVMISDLRGYIYELKARGFRIKDVTMDGFQSTDTMQQLRKKRYRVHYLSVDRSKLPYEDLRDALYEDRIEIPPYMTYLSAGEGETILIANRELEQLEDTGKKVDHPANGSKDVADGLAGVVNRLMGDRSYRRRIGSEEAESSPDAYDPFNQSAPHDPFAAMPGQFSKQNPMSAPVPPSMPIPGGMRGW
jgi:hypothetical protein